MTEFGNTFIYYYDSKNSFFLAEFADLENTCKILLIETVTLIPGQKTYKINIKTDNVNGQFCFCFVFFLIN